MTKNQHAPARTDAPPAMNDEHPILTPEGLLQAIAELRPKIEQTLALAEPEQPIDTDALLQAITELRMAFERTLTPEERAALPQAEAIDQAAPYLYSSVHRHQAIEDFALESARETLALLAAQADAMVEMKSQQAYRMALRIYYAMEDALADDPENLEMQAHMENMRRAHQSQYGKPIPPRDAAE